MADEDVDILLQLKNLQQFVSETKLAGDSVSSIGTKASAASDRTIASARRVPGVIGLIGRAARTSAVGVERTSSVYSSFFRGIERGATRATSYVREKFASLRHALSRPFHSKVDATIGGGAVRGLRGGLGLGGTLGVGLLSYLSVSSLKKAIDFTSELGHVTANTAKVTGASAQSLGSLFALAQANGVSMSQLAMSFRLISNQVVAANKGTKSSVELFGQLGISQKQLRATGGNLQSVLGLVLDRFDKLPAGVAKTEIAGKLFGRSWQNLLPIIGQGSKELRAQQQMAQQLGITMGGNPLKATQQLHDAQVKLKLAGMGLQIFIATKLLPVFLWLATHLLKLYATIRQKVGPIFSWFKDKILMPTVRFLRQFPGVLGALKEALKTVIPVLIALKVAQTLWNIAMLSNPWTWVIMAVVALVTALIYAWKHSKTFRDTVIKVWDDVKAAAVAAWNGVLKPVFMWLKTAIVTVVIPALISMGHFFAKVWQGIVAVSKWAWANVLHPLFIVLKAIIVNYVVPAVQLVASVFKFAWTLISGVVKVAWAILQPIFHLIGWFFKTFIIPELKILWSVFKFVWNAISGVVTFVWHNVLNPILIAIGAAFKWISGFLSTLSGAFQTAFSGVASFLTGIFNTVKNVVVSVLNWIIDRINNVIDVLNILPGVSIGHIGHIGAGSATGVSTTGAGNALHPPVGPAAVKKWGSQPLSLGKRALGGPIQRTGMYVIGEHGAELMHLPAGAHVKPMRPSDHYQPVDPSLKIGLTSIVQVDRREIARAYGRFVDDRTARRG